MPKGVDMLETIATYVHPANKRHGSGQGQGDLSIE